MPPTVKGNQTVELEGRGVVTLKSSDHIATGGEGSIYRVGKDTVVKVYTDPLLMKKKGMSEKIRRLSTLKSPYVVAPGGIVFSKAGDPIGYHMPLASGHPLSRVFTNDFWKLHHFTATHASQLVARMKDTVNFAHQHQAILVDPNELNWFVEFSGNEPEPRIVDVDSWAIGRWGASAIIPSIRDWHSKVFDEKSDWFSWGVVTFQVYTGIHPYKGTLDPFRKGEFLERMKANASVFTPNVRLNQAVRDFALVPSRLLVWYEATFQHGERAEPPSPFDFGTTARAALIQRVVTTGKTGLLIFEKILGFANDQIVRTYPCGVVLLQSGKLLELSTKRQIASAYSTGCEVIKVQSGWLIAEKVKDEVVFRHVADGNLREGSLSFRMRAQHIVRYENRIFLITDQGMTEVKLHDFGNRVVASVGQTWGVLVNSTRWFDGLGVQDALGAMFVVAPTNDTGVVQIRVPELDGTKVVVAKMGNRFAALILLDRNGAYQKFSLTFDKDYKTYNLTKTIVDQPELNLAPLPKGVCASIEEDGKLSIFVPVNNSVTEIEDKQVKTDMVLSNWGDKVIYIQDGALWTVRMI